MNVFSSIKTKNQIPNQKSTTLNQNTRSHYWNRLPTKTHSAPYQTNTNNQRHEHTFTQICSTLNSLNNSNPQMNPQLLNWYELNKPEFKATSVTQTHEFKPELTYNFGDISIVNMCAVSFTEKHDIFEENLSNINTIYVFVYVHTQIHTHTYTLPLHPVHPGIPVLSNWEYFTVFIHGGVSSPRFIQPKKPWINPLIHPNSNSCSLVTFYYAPAPCSLALCLFNGKQDMVISTANALQCITN